MTERSLLKIENVSKAFQGRTFRDILRRQPAQRIHALRSVSLELKAGKVTALLGPNGAGKTTLINIVCDLTRADSGNVTLAGHPVPDPTFAAQRQIGYVTTNDRSFFWRLSGRKNLEFFAALQGYTAAQSRHKAGEMLERFRLSGYADRPFHTYSAGTKKRLGLARAFLHDPAVLLLDEPTNGLDAKSTEELLGLIRHGLDLTGKTILWATHRAEEIGRLCDRVIVLIDGGVAFDGGAAEFLGISKRHMIFTAEVQRPANRRAEFERLLTSLGLSAGPDKTDGFCQVSGVGDERSLSAGLTALLGAGGLIRQIERQPEPLHKVFAHLEGALHTESRSPEPAETQG